MKRFHLFVLCGVIALVGAVLVFRLWPHAPAADIFPDESITVDEGIRRYRLVVPHRLPADRVPVVFAFHGIGDSTVSMSDYSELDRLAAECGFILVYPAARNSMWATMNLDVNNLETHPDIRFFDRLLEHLESRFRIDGKRIYLVGMSNGASFAQVVAHARPNVAAVVAHSGVKPRELGPARRPFPILFLVGTEDAAAEAMTSDAAKYRALGHHAEFVSIPDLGHEWSPRNNSAIWQFLSNHDCEE